MLTHRHVSTHLIADVTALLAHAGKHTTCAPRTYVTPRVTGAEQHVRECVYNSYVSVRARVRWHERRSRCLFSGAPGSRAPPAPGQ